MRAIRSLLAHRRLAVLLCAATLLLKLLVPTGYMIGNDHGRVAIELCSGVASRPMMAAMPGMHGASTGHDKSTDHGKGEMPCAFSGLSAASLAAIDPIQLAVLIAFATSVGLVGTALPLPSRRTQLRPPLRGPPGTL